MTLPVLPSLRVSIIGAAGAIVLLLCGLAGCASSEYRYTTKIATGERLTFRLVNGRVDPAVAEGLEAKPPVMAPDVKQKKVRYVFGLAVKPSESLQRVRVDDVSDDRAVPLVDDTDPQIKNGLWTGHSAWFGADEPEVLWVNYLGESFRVYRITVTKADGREFVLHEGSVTPAFAKGMMRHVFGKDY